MKYDFHPEALQEYADATAYYADISSRLAKAFVNEIEKGIQHILDHPTA
jgi:plasmid stabilization system protein ParE